MYQVFSTSVDIKKLKHEILSAEFHVFHHHKDNYASYNYLAGCQKYSTYLFSVIDF